MSPFLRYSGRGGNHRGRGRGRGNVGRGIGRGRGGRGNSIDLRANNNLNKHKWVRPSSSMEVKHDIDDHQNDKSKAEKISGKSNSFPHAQAGTEEESDEIKEKCLPTPTCSHRIMKRSGQHKLVLNSETKIRPTTPAINPKDSFSGSELQARQPSAQGQTLTREGRNKLVSLSTSSAIKAKEQNKTLSMGSYSADANLKYKGLYTRHKVAAPPPTISRPTAKRVKLSVQPKSTMIERDTIPTNEAKKNIGPANEPLSSTGETIPTDVDPSSKPKPVEKLSDFAYREVSRVRQRERMSGRSLRWSKKKKDDASSNEPSSNEMSLQSPTAVGNPNKSPKIKNMALVRVQPDEKRTPICPVFLRGLHCQDPYCRKRHDIPKEHAMPVCSFFQKHGQCLRGKSCVFRHIKLNANAQVCPSFAILGFCEDPDCKLQHIRGEKAKSAFDENETCTATTERQSSRFRRKPNKVYHRKKL